MLCAAAVAQNEPVCASEDEACQAESGKSSALLQVQTRRLDISGVQMLEDTPQGDSGKFRLDHQWKSGETMPPALSYFKWWSDGRVKRHFKSLGAEKESADLGPLEMVQVNASEGTVSAAGMVALLAKHKKEVCPNAPSPAMLSVSSWSVHSNSHDDFGVQHVVLRSEEAGGKLQYIATHADNLVVSDPEVCTWQDVQDVSMMQQPEIEMPQPDDAGEPELLDADTDPLVADCVKLFHRTAMENCNRDFDIRVLSATLHIIDGFAVNANIELTGTKITYHNIECDFETPRTPDASLLQKKGIGKKTKKHAKPGDHKRKKVTLGGPNGEVPNNNEPEPEQMPEPIGENISPSPNAAQNDEPVGENIPSPSPSPSPGINEPNQEEIPDEEDQIPEELLKEEKDGLEATLRMGINICAADSQSSAADEEELTLLAKYSFGHLPAYKGYGHLEDEEYENIPVFLTQRESAPTSYSMQDKYPMCFPDRGREVIRNQGTCGSCWAFAAASALMTNLCASGQGRHALANANDRFEVSVQNIMSCQSRGCSGGNAQSAGTALNKVGIAKERDFPYRCGGGNALKHFEVPSGRCSSGNSWGASCPQSRHKNQAWTYGGIARAGSGRGRSNAGEAAIMKTLVECGSGYINFKTYGNFMKYKSGIYSSISGGKRGGHAVTLIGYGAARGTKYWYIANSWGTKWGQNGYVYFLRGRNLAEIESSYYCMKGSVKAGGSAPPAPSPPRPSGPRPSPPSPRPGGSGKPAPPSPQPGKQSAATAESISKIEKKVDQAIAGLDAIKPHLQEAKQELGKLKQQPALRDAPAPAPVPAATPAPPPPPPPRPAARPAPVPSRRPRPRPTNRRRYVAAGRRRRYTR